MPNYKLIYFDAKGRAEISRLILAQAGVPYDDVRMTGEQWAKIKTTSPFGQLPMLETEGVAICQSSAIARFLARKHGLAGKSDLDQAKADMIVGCVEDTTSPLLDIFHEKDEKKKEQLLQKYKDETLPDKLAKLEKMLASNSGGDGFFVGNEVTWADLAFALMCTWPELVKIDMSLDKYPKLKVLRKRVDTLPKIAEWIAKRPVTAH